MRVTQKWTLDELCQTAEMWVAKSIYQLKMVLISRIYGLISFFLMIYTKECAVSLGAGMALAVMRTRESPPVPLGGSCSQTSRGHCWSPGGPAGHLHARPECGLGLDQTHSLDHTWQMQSHLGGPQREGGSHPSPLRGTAWVGGHGPSFHAPSGWPLALWAGSARYRVCGSVLHLLEVPKPTFLPPRGSEGRPCCGCCSPPPHGA